MEESNAIENYNYYQKFHSNLKALKKNAKRKKRQTFLKNFTKMLSQYQIITIIKFNPKLYLKPDELISLMENFEGKNMENIKEPKIIALPDSEEKEEIENLFFEKNNISLFHHLSIPISSNLDLNLDGSFLTKNYYLFYAFDIYASYTAFSDLKIKNGITLGKQDGFFFSLEKNIDQHKVVGASISFKKVNFAEKELLTLWYKKNQNNLLYVNVGSKEALGWRFFKDFSTFKFFVNPEVHRVNIIYPYPNIKAGISIKSKVIGLKTKVFTYISQIYSKWSLNFNIKAFYMWKGILSFDIYHNKTIVCNLGFKKNNFKLEVPIYVSNLENIWLFKEQNNKLFSALFVGAAIAVSLFSRYFYLKKKKIQEFKNKKQIIDKISKRETEIKLIQKKAAESYINECKNNGLVIIEAYYGSSQIIDELIFVQDKILFLEKNQHKKKKIIDVTIPLRFQVNDSKLTLYGNSKKHLFGFYNPSDSHEKNYLYIKYYVNKILKENIYEDKEEFEIKAEKPSNENLY